MNRLNLASIVNKNLSGETKFFRATQINSEDFYDNERYNEKIKYVQEHANISEQINSIVAHVHRQLRTQKPSPTKQILKTASKKSLEKVQKNHEQNAQTKLSYRIVENPGRDKKNSIVVDVPGNMKINIPRMKAICNRKTEKRIHQTIPSLENPNSLENQKTYQKILHQNIILQNLLLQHKQLQHYRQSISSDILLLRSSLDHIRVRLNNALKKLNDKKTYCELHGLTSCKDCVKAID